MRVFVVLWSVVILAAVYACLFFAAAWLLGIDAVGWRHALGLGAVYVAIRSLDEAVWAAARRDPDDAVRSLRDRPARSVRRN